MNTLLEKVNPETTAKGRWGKGWKVLLFVLKLAISSYILWRIAGKIALGTTIKGMFAMPVGIICILVALTTVRHLAQYHNWLFALRVNPGYVVNKRQVLSSYLIGLPLRFAIPGGHASIAKILYVSNSSRAASFWSTVLERGFMTWAAWTFAAGAALLYYTQYSPLIFIALFAVILLLPEFLSLALGNNRKWRHIKEPYTRMAGGMLIMQIANTLITYLQYWLILNQFVRLSWLDTAIRMALTQFSNSIPITIAGLGLRESFAIHFLKGTGISAEQAVAATLSLFVIQDVFPALVGLGFLVKGKRTLAVNKP